MPNYVLPTVWGGKVTIPANSLAEAEAIAQQSQLWNPGMGTFGAESSPGGDGGGGGGGAPGGGGGAGGSDSDFQAMMRAQAEYERVALEEKQREFNVSQYRELATGLTEAASRLQGPQDYFKFLTLTSGGRNLFQQLYGNQGRPAFSAPGSPTQALTIQDVLNQLGLGSGSPSIGTAAPQAYQDLVKQQGQQAGIDVPGFGRIPYAYQINPSVWNSLGQGGQSFMRAAAAAGGYDPQQYEAEQMASRPQGRASPVTSMSYQAPQSGYNQPAFVGNERATLYDY